MDGMWSVGAMRQRPPISLGLNAPIRRHPAAPGVFDEAANTPRCIADALKAPRRGPTFGRVGAKFSNLVRA